MELLAKRYPSMDLYKKQPSEYPDWDKYNPPGGRGQLGRFKTDILTCLNPECPRFRGEVSEREAFYLFVKQGLFQRMKPVMLPCRLKSLYVCPFCGRADQLHPANNDISII